MRLRLSGFKRRWFKMSSDRLKTVWTGSVRLCSSDPWSSTGISPGVCLISHNGDYCLDVSKKSAAVIYRMLNNTTPGPMASNTQFVFTWGNIDSSLSLISSFQLLKQIICCSVFSHLNIMQLLNQLQVMLHVLRSVSSGSINRWVRWSAAGCCSLSVKKIWSDCLSSD